VYGDYRNPAELGSGGGRADGGPGGGLVRLTAASAQIDGAILANGVSSGVGDDRGCGSGGGIRLDVDTLAGAGRIAADGGAAARFWEGGGGGGRVAVYYDEISGFDPARIAAHGAQGHQGCGSVGTVYLKDRNGAGELRVDSHGTPVGMWTPLGQSTETQLVVDRLVVAGAGVVAAPEHQMPVVVTGLALFGGAVLTHLPATASQTYWLDLRAAESLSIDAASSIDVSGRGYLPGRTVGNTTPGGATGSSGGSYGGRGCDRWGTANQPYGEAAYPAELGSGGGARDPRAGAGGGRVRIETPQAEIDGAILALGGRGEADDVGCGSGGSILLNVETLSGTGRIAADGGSSHLWAGGGGGGRVAVYHSGPMSLPDSGITAEGGVGICIGQAGSVCISARPRAQWLSLEQPYAHGQETLGWDGLALPLDGVTVDVWAYPSRVPLAVGLGHVGQLAWDTTAFADGIYEVRLIFRDAEGVALLESMRSVLVSNAVAWHGGALEGDETWGADRVHVVESTVTVPAGVTLTLAPGAVVKFVDGTGVVVEAGGGLSAETTAAQPIVLTALADDTAGGDTNLDGDRSRPVPGCWNGLLLPDAREIVLGDFVELRYHRQMHRGTLAASATWSGTVLHELLGDVTVPDGVTLTLAPGAVVKSGEGEGLTVQTGGELRAEGSQAQPIVFTSVRDDSAGGDSNGDGDVTAPAMGDWEALVAAGGTIVLDHTTVAYGGFTTRVLGGMLEANGGGRLTVRSSLLREPLLEAVFNDGGTVDLTNCVLVGADRAVQTNSGPVTLLHCTIDDATVGAVGHGAPIEVTNSVIVNCRGSAAAERVTVRYSNVWNCHPNGVSSADGNISQDPKFRDPTRGDYRLNYVSPCIDAADGAAAPDTDSMGAPRYDDPRMPNTGVPTATGAFADMGAFEFAETPYSDIRLQVSAVAGPLTARVGETVQLQWTVTNVGATPAVGPWHDGVYLVCRAASRPLLVPVAEVLVAPDVTLGAGGSCTITTEVRVPGSTAATHNWGVLSNCRGDVLEGPSVGDRLVLSTAPVLVDLEELVVDGDALSGQFTSASRECWFKLRAVPGQQVCVSLDLSAEQELTELYGGLDMLPSPEAFDLRSAPSLSAHPRLFVEEGPYTYCYVLASARSLRVPTAGYTIVAATADFALASVSPVGGARTGTVTVTIDGQGIPEGARAQMVTAAGAVILPDAQRRVSASRVIAVFDLRAADAGPADIVVSADQGVSAALVDGFSIARHGNPGFWFTLAGPEAVRPGRQSRLLVRWGNRGDVDVPMHLISIPVPEGTVISTEAHTPPVGAKLTFLTAAPDVPAAVVPPGHENSRVIYLTANAGPAVFQVEARAIAIDDPLAATEMMAWTTLGVTARPPGFSDENWSAFWGQLTSQLGGTAESLLDVAGQNAVMLCRTGSRGPGAPGTGGVEVSRALLTEIDRALTALGWNSGRKDAAADGNQVKALLIGITDDRTGANGDLPASASDVGLVSSCLADHASVPPGNTDVLVDTEAPHDDLDGTKMEAALQDLAASTDPGQTAFFYYSGHGYKTGLALPDNETYGWPELYRNLNATKGDRVVVVLDSCYSGGFVDWLNNPENFHDPECPPPDPSKWTVVTACNTDQQSMSGMLEYSTFTSAFVKSLESGRTIQEAHQENSTLRSWGVYNRQNPVLYGDNGDFQVSDDAGGVARLVGRVVSSWIINQVLQIQRRTSFDPNEKVTCGVGPAGWVAGDSVLAYTIHFENMATATAPAQCVQVTDHLDASIDWHTIELAATGFNQRTIPPPRGAQSLKDVTTVPTDYYPVRVSAAVNSGDGSVSWAMESYDPATTQTPEDPLAGFLPPNDDTGRGEGFVSFLVRPRPGLPTGTQIRNRARIVFDVNPPIDTNEVLNTIDAGAPTSAVEALPAQTPLPEFSVRWGGQDDAGGSGIAVYDVYAAVDGGAFECWQARTSAAEAAYAGAFGHTYRFRSVAEDAVGHRETKEDGVADAQTTVPPQTTDSDGDGLNNEVEWRIISADLTDAIRTLADVLPHDDFDADGAPNLQEARAGTDPANAANGPAGVPPNGQFLATVVDPARGWWDLTGPYATTVAGRALALDPLMDPKGRIAGMAHLSLTKETVLDLPIKGSAKGSAGALGVKLSLKGTTPDRAASASLTLALTLNPAMRQLTGPATGTVTVGGTKTPVNEDLTLDIPPPMDGTWTLLLDLAPGDKGLAGTATLTVSNGAEYEFLIKGKVAGQTAVLSLTGAPTDPLAKAIRMKAAVLPQEGAWAVLQTFSAKGFGQGLGW
jgi:hypothetical protein